MPSYLLTYDLKTTSPDPRDIVRSELSKAKWFPRIRKGGLSWAYPNTTRSGTFDDDEAAVDAYRTAIRKAEAEKKGKGKVVIEKVYITTRTEVLFETDDKKTPDE